MGKAMKMRISEEIGSEEMSEPTSHATLYSSGMVERGRKSGY
jgi:hypothetical protein